MSNLAKFTAQPIRLNEHCLIQPSGRFDLATILDGTWNIDCVVATLGLKEITQGIPIR
jgi:hypothetical protein